MKKGFLFVGNSKGFGVFPKWCVLSKQCNEWFEPGENICSVSLIVQARVVLKGLLSVVVTSVSCTSIRGSHRRVEWRAVVNWVQLGSVCSNWFVSLAARDCKGKLYLYATSAENRKRYQVSVDDGWMMFQWRFIPQP